MHPMTLVSAHNIYVHISFVHNVEYCYTIAIYLNRVACVAARYDVMLPGSTPVDHSFFTGSCSSLKPVFYNWIEWYFT